MGTMRFLWWRRDIAKLLQWLDLQWWIYSCHCGRFTEGWVISSPLFRDACVCRHFINICRCGPRVTWRMTYLLAGDVPLNSIIAHLWAHYRVTHYDINDYYFNDNVSQGRLSSPQSMTHSPNFATQSPHKTLKTIIEHRRHTSLVDVSNWVDTLL